MLTFRLFPLPQGSRPEKPDAAIHCAEISLASSLLPTAVKLDNPVWQLFLAHWWERGSLGRHTPRRAGSWCRLHAQGWRGPVGSPRVLGRFLHCGGGWSHTSWRTRPLCRTHGTRRRPFRGKRTAVLNPRLISHNKNWRGRSSALGRAKPRALGGDRPGRIFWRFNFRPWRSRLPVQRAHAQSRFRGSAGAFVLAVRFVTENFVLVDVHVAAWAFLVLAVHLVQDKLRLRMPIQIAGPRRRRKHVGHVSRCGPVVAAYGIVRPIWNTGVGHVIWRPQPLPWGSTQRM